MPLIEDPQLDDPLTDEEFDLLDEFLLSDRTGDECMTMDMLHGFLTALAIGPEPVSMEEWLPKVWGQEPGDVPAFKNAAEQKKITRLIGRFMNEIAIIFEVAPNEYEPLFCECEFQGKALSDGEAWTWGFMDGVSLRSKAWEPLWQSTLKERVAALVTLAKTADQEDESEPVWRHKLSVEVEDAIGPIQRYWSAARMI